MGGGVAETWVIGDEEAATDAMVKASRKTSSSSSVTVTTSSLVLSPCLAARALRFVDTCLYFHRNKHFVSTIRLLYVFIVIQKRMVGYR